MINLLQDGAFIFHSYKVAIFIFFVSAFGIGWFSIRHVVDFELDYGVELMASLCLGVVILCLVSFILVVLSYILPFIFILGCYCILLFAVFVLLRGFVLSETNIPNKTLAFSYIALLFLFLLIRLAFLKYIILPPYSDSPIHYQIVFGFLHPNANITSRLSLETIFSNYYHFGFHSIVAWLTEITGDDPANIISLVGQLLLVIAPISIIFMVKVLTNNNFGALFAGLLAALGWYMPAFAVNWGKYPAIGALATLPAAAAILILWQRNHKYSPMNICLILVVLIGSTLLHTRALICLLLFAICWVIVRKLPLDQRLGDFQAVRYTLICVFSLWMLKSYLSDYYGNLSIASILCVLLFFAFREYQRLSIGIFLFTLGSWLITVMPLLFGDRYHTLLDQQFLEIMLFIPLSIFGGLGVSGLIKAIPANGLIHVFIISLLASVIIFGSHWNKTTYPDECCNYFTLDDQLAFGWLGSHVEEHDLILISAFDNKGQVIGTDSGIWIYPLLKQSTNKLYFGTDWASSNELSEICGFGAINTYIYNGGKLYSFDSSQLVQENFAKVVFKAGQVSIFQIPNCSK